MFEGGRGGLDRRGIKRPARHRGGDLGELHRVPHVDLAVQPDGLETHALAVQPLADQLLQVGEVLLGARGVERDDRRVGELGGQRDIRGRQPEGRERRGHRAERDHHLGDPDLGGVAGAVRGAGAAEGVQHELARVVAGLHDGLAQQVAGLGVLHRVDRGRGLLHGQPERLGDLRVDGLAGQLQRQRLAAAEQPPLGEDPQDEVGVGVGRIGAAVAVAGGAGNGLRAARPDPQVAAGVEPGDRAAAGADRAYPQRGHVDRVVVDHGRGVADGLAVDYQADEERGAAHVGGDDVAVAELAAQGDRADDAAGEHRADRADRRRRCLPGDHGAAVALHDQQRPGEPVLPQGVLQRGQVVPQPRPDLGAHDGGGVAGELPDAGADLAGQRDEYLRVLLGDQLAQPPLVHGVAEGPQQRHRDRADPVVEQ